MPLHKFERGVEKPSRKFRFEFRIKTLFRVSLRILDSSLDSKNPRTHPRSAIRFANPLESSGKLWKALEGSGKISRICGFEIQAEFCDIIHTYICIHTCTYKYTYTYTYIHYFKTFFAMFTFSKIGL